MLIRYISKLKNIRSLNKFTLNRKCTSFYQAFGEPNFVENSKLSFHHNNFGELSSGSVVCRHGDTVVHVAVTTSYNNNPTAGFLPLIVDYRMKKHSIGKIPNTVTGRERFNEDSDILAARVIDRSVRPLFPKGFYDEILITVTVQSYDGIHDPVSTAINATSLAIIRSGLPWNGPIGSVRVGLLNGNFFLNPSLDDLKISQLDLLYSGTENKTLMIETLAYEIPEDIFKNAVYFAQKSLKNIIETQKNITSSNNDFFLNVLKEYHIFKPSDSLIQFIYDSYKDEIIKIFQNNNNLPRKERSRLEGKMIYELKSLLKNHEEYSKLDNTTRDVAVNEIMTKCFREIIINQKSINNLSAKNEKNIIKRIDNRNSNELRKISCSVGNLPIVHGSSYFQRGDTHVLCTTTLGSIDDIFINKSSFNIINHHYNFLDLYENNNFFLNYDFPNYCTGDVGMNQSSNRRMVGHGNLAEKALIPVIPPFKLFPYCIRVTSECTASNGSSSMASVCGASLALMDCGVPIKEAVAGISIGLISKSVDNSIEDYVLLTDILGMEDHYGDMDFKIAGTTNGITAIQLDVKLPGVPTNILLEALDKAKDCRSKILNEMNVTIPKPNKLTKQNAPKAEVITFDVERAKFLIGPSGEMSNNIEKTYNVSLSIDSTNGTAYVYGLNQKEVNKAIMYIKDIVSTINIDDITIAEIISIKDYGLIVKLMKSQEALLHLSEISHDKTLLKKQLIDLFTVGQKIEVKVIFVDKMSGLIKVSRKALLEPNQSIPDKIIPVEEDLIDNNTTNFPITPPKKYRQEYFRSNIVSKQEIEKMLSTSNNIRETKSKHNEIKSIDSDDTKVDNIIINPVESTKDSRNEINGLHNNIIDSTQDVNVNKNNIDTTEQESIDEENLSDNNILESIDEISSQEDTVSDDIKSAIHSLSELMIQSDLKINAMDKKKLIVVNSEGVEIPNYHSQHAHLSKDEILKLIKSNEKNNNNDNNKVYYDDNDEKNNDDINKIEKEKRKRNRKKSKNFMNKAIESKDSNNAEKFIHDRIRKETKPLLVNEFSSKKNSTRNENYYEKLNTISNDSTKLVQQNDNNTTENSKVISKQINENVIDNSTNDKISLQINKMNTSSLLNSVLESDNVDKDRNASIKISELKSDNSELAKNSLISISKGGDDDDTNNNGTPYYNKTFKITIKPK